MRSGAGVYQHDLQWAQIVADPGQFGPDVGGGRHVAVAEVTEVQLDRRLQAPLEGNFVDGDGAPAGASRWVPLCVVIRTRSMAQPSPSGRSPTVAPGKKDTTSAAVCRWS
jgi:hypothetical protein